MVQKLREYKSIKNHLLRVEKEVADFIFNDIRATVEERLKDFSFDTFNEVLKKSTDNKDYLYHFDFLTSDKYIHSIVIGYDKKDNLYTMKIGRAIIKDSNNYNFEDFIMCISFGECPITAYDPNLEDSYKWALNQVLWHLSYLVYDCEGDIL